MHFKKTSYHQINDEKLMQLSCSGDRMAFEELYNRYFDKLVLFAKKMLNEDRQKAEDLVQEVFVKIIDKPNLFDQNKKFSTWVYTITTNLCKNVWRDEQNRSRLLEENASKRWSNVTHLHPQNDLLLLKERIRELYKGLSEKEKSIFVLRFEHELSIKEISQITELPEGSVKSGVYYLLKKVANHLKEFKHGE